MRTTRGRVSSPRRSRGGRTGGGAGADVSQLSAAHLRDLQQQLQFLDMEAKEIRKGQSKSTSLDAQLRQVQASHDSQRMKFEGKWAAQQRRVHELDTSLRVRTMQIERLTTEQGEHTVVYEEKLMALRARLEESEVRCLAVKRQLAAMATRLEGADEEKDRSVAAVQAQLDQATAECAAQRVALEHATEASAKALTSEARMRELCEEMNVKSAADDERVRFAEAATATAEASAARANEKMMQMQLAHDEAVTSHEQLVVKCDTAERQVSSLLAERVKLRAAHDDFEVTRLRLAGARDRYQGLLVESETKAKRLTFVGQENKRTIAALQAQLDDDLESEKETALLQEERLAEQIATLRLEARREHGALRAQAAALEANLDRERTAKTMVEEALCEIRVERDSQQRRLLSAVSTQVAQEQELVQLREAREKEQVGHAKELTEMKRLRSMAVEQQAAFDAFLSSHA